MYWSAYLQAALVLFGVFVAIAWVLLPFAMFGLKPLLRQLVTEQRKTNELLADRAKRGEQ